MEAIKASTASGSLRETHVVLYVESSVWQGVVINLDTSLALYYLYCFRLNIIACLRTIAGSAPGPCHQSPGLHSCE